MSATTHDKDYLARVCASLPQDHPIRNASNNAQPQHQRVLYTCLNIPTTASPSLPQLLRQHADAEARIRIAVCLVENISQEWIAAPGTTWNIDHAFFSGHASNPSGESIWEALMNPGGKWEDWTPNCSDASAQRIVHLHGLFEFLGEDVARYQRDRFPRRFQPHPHWGLQCNSKVSYCRVLPHLCKFCQSLGEECGPSTCLDLILTDLPFPKSLDSQLHHDLLLTHLCLRFPFSRNYGGLAIPQQYDRNEFSALDIFAAFLKHAWHWGILFADHLKGSAVQPMILSNFLAASMWRTRPQCVDNQMQHVPDTRRQ